MDVKAILLIGSDLDGTTSVSAGTPLATIDILGRPIAFRIAERMKRFGVDTVYMIGAVDTLKSAPAVPADVQFVAADGAPWRECENVFNEVAQSGADLVLVQRLGPYLELDYEDLIGLHLDRRNRVTPVCGGNGDPLGVFCISASRRNDAAFLFRHQLQESRTPCIGYDYRGYCNPLQSGADLRRLTLDALNGTVQLPPAGRQIRPGVWVGEGARIERGARVLAPAFIGAHAVVRPAAVITRFSSVEHHAEIDCGTVIEDASVLPYTYVGAGLDVSHSVIGNQRLLNLPRNVEIEVSDPKLVRTLSEHAPIRALSALASPKRFLQNVLGLRPQPASLPAAVKAPSAALKSPASLRAAAQSGDAEFPANLMVVRRYGNE